MPQNKAELRNALLSLRNGLGRAVLTKEMLFPFDAFSKGKVIFCYASFGSEVDTHSLISELLTKKIVVVPYCTDLNGNMICVQVNSFSDLQKGHFGILEPKNPHPFPKELIDVAIVPGVAFDKRGYRIGYGKGYYDRFLKDISPFKLGVCHKECIVDNFLCDSHDVRMDKVLCIEAKGGI